MTGFLHDIRCNSNCYVVPFYNTYWQIYILYCTLEWLESVAFVRGILSCAKKSYGVNVENVKGPLLCESHAFFAVSGIVLECF